MRSYATRFALVAAFLFASTVASEAGDAGPAGLWFILKNECPGAASAGVADRICAVTIGTASFNRVVQSGEVPAGFSAQINICADKSGNGMLEFAPTNATTAPVYVSVKPNSTVAYPKYFCKK